MKYKLRITQQQFDILHQHHFGLDSNEAVSIMLCGCRKGSENHVFTVRRVIPVPFSKCAFRTKSSVKWSTEIFDSLIEEILRDDLSVIKVHNHPSGNLSFSHIDDISDKELFSSLSNFIGDNRLHGSVILLPENKAFIGRVIDGSNIVAPLSLITIVGDDIKTFAYDKDQKSEACSIRHEQFFGKGTTNILSKLSVGIVGCSGTGSIVAEQLARLGVGELILVDDDIVEEKNLNRIVGSCREDANLEKNKTIVTASVIARMGLDRKVIALPLNLDCRVAVEHIAECDVVFGCVDSKEGRHILNKLTTFYNQPYFDLGVRLDADGDGGIDCAAGVVHYLQPGLSPLIDRGVYTMAEVDSEALKRVSPELYKQSLDAGYLRGVQEDRPAVISINMLIASLAVNDFLARIHPYRNNPNNNYSAIAANLTEVVILTEPESYKPGMFFDKIGLGDIEPLLGKSSLSELLS